MRKVVEYAKVNSFKKHGLVCMPIPSQLSNFFGFKELKHVRVSAKRTKKHLVVTFHAPTLPSPRDPTPHPPLTSSNRRRKRRRRKQRRPFRLIKDLELERLKRVREVFGD